MLCSPLLNGLLKLTELAYQAYGAFVSVVELEEIGRTVADPIPVDRSTEYNGGAGWSCSGLRAWKEISASIGFCKFFGCSPEMFLAAFELSWIHPKRFEIIVRYHMVFSCYSCWMIEAKGSLQKLKSIFVAVFLMGSPAFITVISRLLNSLPS